MEPPVEQRCSELVDDHLLRARRRHESAAVDNYRRWLAGEDFSLADVAAAAHLSAVDYLGDVPWEDHLGAKDWYARVKSRPSLRPILSDHIPGALPSAHYADLDF